MKDIESRKDKYDDQLIEDINQIHTVGFGEGAAICQVCATEIRGGEPVTAYAFRPVSEPEFEIGPIFCKQHGNKIPNLWTRGVRELIVRGRVGTVTDAAEQASWPVLLDPELVLVSPACAVEAYSVEEWRELQSPSVEDVGVAGGDDTVVEVNEAVAEVNELAEPTDSMRPAGDPWVRRDGDAGEDEGGDAA